MATLTNTTPQTLETNQQQMSDYEKTREERIKQNLNRMQNLGIFDLSLKLKSVKPVRKNRFSSDCKGSLTSPPTIQSPEPVRRSSRSSKSFKPKSEFPATTNPHFVTSVHPSPPYHLYIPKALLVEIGVELEPQMNLLDLINGKRWPVDVVVWGDGRHTFVADWRDFWEYYDLQEHDKIRFEFLFGRGKKKRLGKTILLAIVRGQGQSNEAK